MNKPLVAFLRKYPGLIEGMDTIPLFGNSPPFNWDRFSDILASRFELQDFSVRASEQSWYVADKIKNLAGPHDFCVEIFLNPLSSPFYFILPKMDKNKLASSMMQGKPRMQISEAVKEGFCRFLVAEALAASSNLEPLAKLTPLLGDGKTPPEEKCYCQEIEITLGESSAWAKLLFPDSFRLAWISHFSKRAPEYFPTALAQSIELTAELISGSIHMNLSEWKELQPGDFVILDKGNFLPKEQRGLALLQVKNIPLFQAKIEKGKIELLEHVFLNDEEPLEEKMQENESSIDREEEKSESIKDVPIVVSVELARLKITLDRLMHLSAGNILELPIDPSQEAFLTVNGKKIGRAELLNLGESLGIRILELGA